MNTASERRAPGTTRIPFDGMVEVGGSLGPSFEAQAVNLSEEGMQIRTAYVPEVGQPITCRFDAGQGLTVVAAGEVLWSEDDGGGGQFGIRFTNLDSHSTVSLQRIIGMAEDGVLPRAPQGKKVRLHIDGLASPMRARLRSSEATCATAYSELGFLEMGKALDLEDASSGTRRPARIERVDVEVEEGSLVPQLIVSLRYDDEEARAALEPRGGSLAGVSLEDAPAADVPRDPDPTDEEPPPVEAAAAEEPLAEGRSTTIEVGAAHDAAESTASKLKGALSQTASKVGPLMGQWLERGKTTFALLAAKARRASPKDDAEAPIRRTTAPAPGGGLHATGRKVVRGEPQGDKAVAMPPKARFKITKRRAIAAGIVAATTGIAAIGLSRSDEPPAEVATAATAQALQEPAPPAPAEPAEETLTAAADLAGEGPEAVPPAPAPRIKPGRPRPFGTGAVGSGNVIRIKMDGHVDAIQGASQPTGFTVVVPHRHAAEAVAGLSKRDPRIAALKVANEREGAELSVSFKDGVPNYQVRGRGDTLEIVLAKPSSGGGKPASASRSKHKTTTKRRKKR